MVIMTSLTVCRHNIVSMLTSVGGDFAITLVFGAHPAHFIRLEYLIDTLLCVRE